MHEVVHSNLHSKLFGKGLPDQMRSTAFAFLGLTAAGALALVAIFAQLSFPLLSPVPLPSDPSRDNAVAEAVPVKDGVRGAAVDDRARAVAPSRTGDVAARPSPGPSGGDDAGSGEPAPAAPPQPAGAPAPGGVGDAGGQPGSRPAPAPAPAPAPQPAPEPAPVAEPAPISQPPASPPPAAEPPAAPAAPAPAASPPAHSNAGGNGKGNAYGLSK